MPATTKAIDRYVPSLKDKVHHDVETEVRRLWLSIFNLLDAKLDVLDMTLTANAKVDRELIAGRPLLVILRQNATGGWTVTWATNPDGTLKFKGQNLITLTTTANTYSALLFYAVSDKEAVLVSKDATGGTL